VGVVFYLIIQMSAGQATSIGIEQEEAADSQITFNL